MTAANKGQPRQTWRVSLEFDVLSIANDLLNALMMTVHSKSTSIVSIEFSSKQGTSLFASHVEFL